MKALWCLWLLLLLLALAQHTGAVKQHNKQQQRQRQRQQQPGSFEPLSAFLGLLSATAAPTLVTYKAVHAWNHSLPLPQLQNGIVYRGSSARLRSAVSKLLHGEAVHIAAVGGSITYGRGVERGTSDWFSLFSAWLTAAFPAAKVTAANAAEPLAQSEYIAACLQQHVDMQADLVFVEVTAADGFLDTSINNELVHAFERLVRQLLLLPHKPAVVVLNALHLPSTLYNPHTSQQQEQGTAAQQLPSAGSLGQKQQQTKKEDSKQQKQQAQQQQQGKQQSKQQKQDAAAFHHTIEDHYGVLAQYYELPWLSLRNAVWQGLIQGWEGFKPQQLFTEVKHPVRYKPQPQHTRKQQPQQQEEGKQQRQQRQEDTQPQQGQSQQTPPQQQQQEQQKDHHQQQHSSYLPNQLGHRYMADLAVSLLQQTFLHQVLRPLPPSDAAAQTERPLPAPMFPGNWEGHGQGCAAGVDLRAAVRDEHKDWYFVSEGSADHPPGWGFVSHVPNATLVLQLDTRSKGATRAFPQLTNTQKVDLLQRHGFFAAAADLLTLDRGGMPLPLWSAGAAEQQAAAAAQQKIWQSGANGLQAAMAEAERQATLVATQLKLAQGKPYVNSERVVGANPFSALQLPQEARLEVGKTKTATGVEVVLPEGHRRRLLDDGDGWSAPGLHQGLEQIQQQQERLLDELHQVLLEERQHAAALSWGTAAPAAAAASVAGVETWGGLINNSTSSSSNSRVLQGLGLAGPQVEPPPYDAVYLKPMPGSGSSSSSSTSTTQQGQAATNNNSSSSGSSSPPGTVGASVFSEYILRPAPSMVVLVGYLKAQHLMGRARIFCVSGCSCREVVVDGWHAQHQHRLATARITVTQSPECLIGVQVLPDTTTGHHKFKVTGVMLAQAVHYRTPDSQWTHQYFLHPDLAAD